MADETHEAPRADGKYGRTPTVFVTDASAESSRIADTLRAAGYLVADVPLSMLVARAQVQRPNVVLVDVDAGSALDEVVRLRKLPGAGAIDFVYFGSGNGPIKNIEDAIANEGSAFFARPVDISALVRRIEALTGGPILRPEKRVSTPPPSLSRFAPDRSSSPSLPAPGLRTPGPPLPMSVPSLADLVEPPRSLATFGTVSSELQQLLSEAELRAEVLPHPDAPLPSPEEEIEAVLPADVLASLDEPLEGDEDEDNEPRPGTGAGHDREGTGHGQKPTTAGGSKQTTASGRPASSTSHAPMRERRLGSDASPSRDETTSRRPFESEDREPRIAVAQAAIAQPPIPVSPITRRERPSALPPAMPEPPRRASVVTENEPMATIEPLRPSQSPVRGPSEAPPRTQLLSAVVLRPVDARRFIADAISRRLSGAICFEHERVVRRIVVRDGDLVTAASGADRESLVSYLGERGDLPRDEAERLAGKIPPYGRHAGAALIAHGWLGQDQLWSVLRAHAEWIATCTLRLEGGVAQLEADPPGRLRSEPSVFAAKAGAEIFVELLRRAVSPEEAIEELGGEASRIGDGPAQALLAECALAPAELELISRARGGTLGDLLARSADPDIACVVHGLALLGVLDVLPAAEPNQSASPNASPAEVAALDDDAIRARIRARLELVDEGDYFSILGVSRNATSYEVRRAFVELRRAFEPTRILSPRLVDLADDVRKIVTVLEEAYEILRDVARRERYRKAIDAPPG